MKFSEFVGKENLNEAVSFSGNLNKMAIKQNMMVLKQVDEINDYLRKDWNNIKSAFYSYMTRGNDLEGINVSIFLDKNMTKQETEYYKGNLEERDSMLLLSAELQSI